MLPYTAMDMLRVMRRATEDETGGEDRHDDQDNDRTTIVPVTQRPEPPSGFGLWRQPARRQSRGLAAARP